MQQNRSARTPVAAPDDMVRAFFLGFIKVHVLHHAAEEDVYGLALGGDTPRKRRQAGPGR